MATATTPPKHPPIVNLPNVLTAARFVLATVLFVLIAWQLRRIRQASVA